MEKVRDYELKDFFTYTIGVLEHLDIPYMVVGGFAAIFYGEPRLTLDVDIVVEMNSAHIKPFVDAFLDAEYYASEEGIRDSLRRRYPFNVIQPTTGAKIDLVPMPRDVFTRMAFQRRRQLTYDEFGHRAMFIAPEDIIVAKLIAYHKTDSEKHLRDVRGVLAMRREELQMETIRHNARANGVLEQLEELLDAEQRNYEERK